MSTPHPPPGPYDTPNDSARSPGDSAWPPGDGAWPPPAPGWPPAGDAPPQPAQIPTQRAAAEDQFPPLAPPPEPRRRRSGLARLMLVIGVVAVGLAAAVGWQAARHLRYEPAPRAAVGECLVGEQPKEMSKVPCADARARWTVLGKVEDITEAKFKGDDRICAAFPGAEYTFWEAADRKDAEGYALCLGPVRR